MGVLPLCTLEEVEAERAETLRQIGRLYDYPAVSPDHAARREERRARLDRWVRLYDAQIAEMERVA